MGYTDHPMLLLNGVSHSTSVRQKGHAKHFKYVLSSLDLQVTVTLRKDLLENYRIFAKLTAFHEKFNYPDADASLDYIKNNSNSKIYTEKENRRAEHMHFEISTADLKAHCLVASQCYVLITVESVNFTAGRFALQASQGFQ